MAKIKYRAVNSSSVGGEFYDMNEMKLYIRFKNQREYVYSNVSPSEYAALYSKESTFGKQLQKTIVKKKSFEELW